MEAVTRKGIKRIGRQITVDLPDDFKAEEVDVIILPSDNNSPEKKDVDLDQWRKDLRGFYANYQVDLSNYKFNRDELYDRP